MNLAPDITPEDLKVFLQETEEQLQLLDRDLVLMEQAGARTDLLQEIFRVAHTIKGSAGMVGHRPMAELAHAMESVLDKLRKGVLLVDTRVIDALLHSLDLLRTLKEQLAAGEEGVVDITPAVEELEAAAGGSTGAPASPNAHASVPLVAAPTLDAETAQKVRAALITGLGVFHISVSLRRDTPWTAVRCFQVLRDLASAGEILHSSPTQQDIEGEKASDRITVTLATREGANTLTKVVSAIEDVLQVEVVPLTADVLNNAAPVPAQPPAPVLAAEVKAQAAAGAAPATVSAAAESNGHHTPNAASQTVRIDVARLDALMNTIGELVIDRTRIIQIGKRLEARYKGDGLVQDLGKTSAHIVKVVNDLQETIMKARMLPIETVFSGFPRMVRDLAQKAEKKVNFTITGQETEIDRTVIERLRDPLVHLLRNSVDHGIERPDQRSAAGKPETGSIRLSAYQEQGSIVITVQDDGRGIDAQRLREATVRKGLISAEAASVLSDEEAVNLIFLSGASTAEKTTEVSGRGVGMDIVKTNIEAINGFLDVDTKVGEGTKFTLKLPLTLATLQALLVSMRETVYAIPIVYVLEALQLEPDEVKTVSGREVITLRGKVLPLLRLSEVFGMADDCEVRPREKACVVVVRFGDRLVGLVVDELIELQEIVVKSLGRYIGGTRGMAGASILGDGQVVLILDVPTLIQTAIARTTRAQAQQSGLGKLRGARPQLAASGASLESGQGGGVE